MVDQDGYGFLAVMRQGVAILSARTQVGTEHTQPQDHPQLQDSMIKAPVSAVIHIIRIKHHRPKRRHQECDTTAGLRDLKLQCFMTYVNASPPVFCFLGKLT